MVMGPVSEVAGSVHAAIIAERYPGRLLLTVSQVGPLIGRSRAQVHRMAAEGKLPFIIVGTRRMVPVGALIQWLEDNEREA